MSENPRIFLKNVATGALSVAVVLHRRNLQALPDGSAAAAHAFRSGGLGPPETARPMTLPRSTDVRCILRRCETSV